MPKNRVGVLDISDFLVFLVGTLEEALNAYPIRKISVGSVDRITTTTTKIGLALSV
jgi:hypothetical protein